MEKVSKVTKAIFDHEWSNVNGNFFDHKIEFENGDKDIYTSVSKEQQNFIVGKEVTYDHVQDQKGNWKCKYDARRQPGFVQGGQSQKDGGYMPKQKDPAEQKRIQKQVAYECALSALVLIDNTNIQKGHDYVIANKIQAWIEEKGKDGINSSITASKAVREAIKAIQIPPLCGQEKGLIEKIISKANEIFTFFMTP